MKGEKPENCVFFPSEDEELSMGLKNTIDYSIPPISDDLLSLWLQEYSPTFSMIPSQDTILTNDASHSPELQTKQEEDATMREGGVDQNPESKRHKRKSSTEAYNLNVRLRRQKLTEKLKALRDIIPNPNSNKGMFYDDIHIQWDKASTLDEAIKYIKTLQYQLQMMSVGYSTFQSPMMMLSQLGQQGIPSQNLAPFLQIGRNTEMKYDIETSNNFSPFYFPMAQLGLPVPCLLSSPSPSSDAANLVQYPENFLGPLYGTSHPYFGAQSNKQEESGPSQDAN